MANKYMKKIFNIISNQGDATQNYTEIFSNSTLTPVRMAIIKNTNSKKH